MSCCKVIGRRKCQLQENFAVLSEYGLTEANVEGLNNLEKQFTAKLDAKEKAVCNRDSATEYRVNKANELYELVSSIRNIGRKMWIEKSEALSNDYIISPTKSNQKNPEPEDSGGIGDEGNNELPNG